MYKGGITDMRGYECLSKAISQGLSSSYAVKYDAFLPAAVSETAEEYLTLISLSKK
jgi:hypothetical protein